jgi:hypothetical protein
MGFRYQRRIKLGGGAGLNVSKSGVSYSVRTRGGSFGTKGFTVRTGIKGLTYRSGRKDPGAGLIVVPIMIAFALIPITIQLLVAILKFLWSLCALLLTPLNAALKTRQARQAPIQSAPQPLLPSADTPSINWTVSPPSPQKPGKISLTASCACGEPILWDDDWPADALIICESCGADWGRLEDFKKEASTFVHRLLG